MTNHVCPRCGSVKATSIMLPAKGAQDTRPHPAFRCMVCDTQWADDEQWATLHEAHADEADARTDEAEADAAQADAAQADARADNDRGTD